MRLETLPVFTDTCGSPQFHVMKAFAWYCVSNNSIHRKRKKTEEERSGPAVCLVLSFDDFALINLVIKSRLA